MSRPNSFGGSVIEISASPAVLATYGGREDSTVLMEGSARGKANPHGEIINEVRATDTATVTCLRVINSLPPRMNRQYRTSSPEQQTMKNCTMAKKNLHLQHANGRSGEI
ncbi:hypothetical protein [Paraburkholderia sediminicola]|uniref:hypothetical protein n=1 Tax=Paraburkholderia sediminicola TaxID=458836 RepID=UPI00158148E4|nr:hypothetical protein [Paraburkholderia sediminicola]